MKSKYINPPQFIIFIFMGVLAVAAAAIDMNMIGDQRRPGQVGHERRHRSFPNPHDQCGSGAELWNDHWPFGKAGWYDLCVKRQNDLLGGIFRVHGHEGGCGPGFWISVFPDLETILKLNEEIVEPSRDMRLSHYEPVFIPSCR